MKIINALLFLSFLLLNSCQEKQNPVPNAGCKAGDIISKGVPTYYIEKDSTSGFVGKTTVELTKLDVAVCIKTQFSAPGYLFNNLIDKPITVILYKDNTFTTSVTSIDCVAKGTTQLGNVPSSVSVDLIKVRY